MLMSVKNMHRLGYQVLIQRFKFSSPWIKLWSSLCDLQQHHGSLLADGEVLRMKNDRQDAATHWDGHISQPIYLKNPKQNSPHHRDRFPELAQTRERSIGKNNGNQYIRRITCHF